MAKYNNTKTRGYDSKREYHRSLLLKQMQRDGEISDLREQVVFELIPKQTEVIIIERVLKKGIKLVEKEVVVERACAYIADFVYIQNGKRIVNDSKGICTEVYRIKKKLMLLIHGIKVFET